MLKIAPSILNANFKELEKELKSVNNIAYWHIDIMDGNFVPNISFGPEITKHVSDIAKVNLDIHLMVLNPLDWIDDFSFDNTEYITVHYESNDFVKALKKIRENKIKTGISIKPKTQVEELIPYLEDIDLVLVMSVQPGFGGQSFMDSSLDKIAWLRDYRTKHNLDYVIEVDGGINDKTAKLVKEAGVDIVVAGSYIFKSGDRDRAVESLK